MDQRDSTQDWLLPADAIPPTVAELERRIDEALVTARASEAAVMTVGAAALDAAEQALRAADLAERASMAVSRREPAVGSLASSSPWRPAEGGMDGFTARADRVAERLRRLQSLPLASTP